ncbi:unnamed protein product, partial [Linum tenue]
HNGADIRWIRSSESRKEVVCAQRDEYGCKWKVYGSWFRGQETFTVKASGPDHSFPRAIQICAAGYKWIASEYLEVFRVNQAWNVNLITDELKTKHNLSEYHNTRRCPMNVGIQAPHVGSSRRNVTDREMRMTMQGIGTYIDENTINMYARLSTWVPESAGGVQPTAPDCPVVGASHLLLSQRCLR